MSKQPYGLGVCNLSDYSKDQLEAFRKGWRDPESIHAMCDDHRAVIDFDFSLAEADLPRRI